MGPLLMTGLNVFGATVALGILASRAVPLPHPNGAVPGPRNLAIIVIAFVTGIGVLGVVVGLLAIEYGLVEDPAAATVAVGPAVVGALLGVSQISRAGRAADRSVASIAVLFITALVALAAVIGVLAVVLREVGAIPPATWPFVVLGATGALAAIAMGVVGANGVAEMAAIDGRVAREVLSRQVRRLAPFQAMGVLATVAAILLVVGAAR